MFITIMACAVLVLAVVSAWVIGRVCGAQEREELNLEWILKYKKDAREARECLEAESKTLRESRAIVARLSLDHQETLEKLHASEELRDQAQRQMAELEQTQKIRLTTLGKLQEELDQIKANGKETIERTFALLSKSGHARQCLEAENKALRETLVSRDAEILRLRESYQKKRRRHA